MTAALMDPFTTDAPPVSVPAPVPSPPADRYVQLRTPTGLTLGTLLERLGSVNREVTTEDVPTREVEFHLDANPGYIQVGTRKVQSSRTGILAFGDLLKVPTAFLNRFTTDVGGGGAQAILEPLLQLYPHSALTMTYGDGGVLKVVEAGRHLIPAESIVAVATRVLGTEDAPISRVVDNAQDFGFDVHVPFDYGHAVGGDRRVGDLTAGGVRIGYNRKRNLAPFTQSYLFRQDCTNGMSHVDPGLKVDARGLSVDGVLAELEAQADRAFSRVEDQIRAFYDLREEKVERVERTVMAIASERKIPERTTRRLLHLASSEALPDDPTMFDLVNLITNTANDAGIKNDGGRLILENAGGAVISAHEARCGHCRQRVAE